MSDRRTWIFCALCALALFQASPSNAASTNYLTVNWRFATGDDPARKDLSFNDSAWQTMASGATWESQNLAGYDGFAWYRQSFTIPSSLRSTAETYGGFVLSLGKIDDSDETYFNGIKVGALGRMPPSYAGAYSEDRVYYVPAYLIRWDALNVVAVRVYDGGGNGGLWSGTSTLSVRDAFSHISVMPDFERSDHTLLGGSQRAGIILSYNHNESLAASVTLSIRSDYGDLYSTGSNSLNLSPNSTTSVPFPVAGLPPGFYSASLSLVSGQDIRSINIRFSVDPERSVSPTDRQTDFQDFWDRTRADLAAVDPRFSMSLSSVQPFAAKTVYLVEMRSLGNVLIRGWLGLPNRPGRHPAILHVQGYSYGFSPTDMYSGDDLVTFSLNIRGHGNSTDDVNPGFPAFIITGLVSKETYIYRGAYMDCLRALDFLVTLPEVDASRIAVEGGSQGGALSYATASLDHRVVLCVPSVPAFSDYRNWYRILPDSGLIAYHRMYHPEQSEETVLRTLSYFDIKNHAPWISVPTLMAVGLRDTSCPPRIGFAAFNNLSGPREWIIYPEAPHSLPPEYRDTKIQWIKEQWGMPLASVIDAQPQDVVTKEGEAASFHANASSNATPSLRWQRLPAGGSNWTDLDEGGSYRGTQSDTLTVGPVTLAMSGDRFRCTASNAAGTVTSNPATLVSLLGETADSAQLSAIAVRSHTGSGEQTLIMGFAVSGTGNKQVVVRGLGPSLSPAGIETVLADPKLRLYALGGALLGENDDWGGVESLQTVFSRIGFTPISPASKDAALLCSLPQGAYSTTIASMDATSGIGLVEVYDCENNANNRFNGLSVRSGVGAGEQVLIAGFALSGTKPAQIMIRGIGPSLYQPGIRNVLPDPKLVLRDLRGGLLAENDDWGGSGAMKTLFSRLGMAPYESDSSHDAALFVTLPPGAYTVILSGQTIAEGIGMIEIYEVR